MGNEARQLFSNMRIAVFLDDIRLSEIGKGIKHIFLFDLDGELVVAVGEELIKTGDINYVCLWLLGKQVQAIYGDDLNSHEKSFLERAGMIVFPLDEIRKNPILNALLVKRDGG